MPLLLLLTGFGLGGWTLSQADDAIETATGERATAGLPILQIILLRGALWFFWGKFKGGRA